MRGHCRRTYGDGIGIRLKIRNLYKRQTLANIWPPSGTGTGFTNNWYPKPTVEYYNWFIAYRSDLSERREPFCENTLDRFHRFVALTYIYIRICICTEGWLALIGYRDLYQVPFRRMNAVEYLFGVSHFPQIETSLITIAMRFHRMKCSVRFHFTWWNHIHYPILHHGVC